MKKNKILIPALAVLALGVAGATTGTVAWFQVTQVAAVDTGTDTGIDNISVNGPTKDTTNYDFEISSSIATSDVGKIILSTIEGNDGAKVLKSYTLDAGLQPVVYTPKTNQNPASNNELQYVHYVVTVVGEFKDHTLTSQAELAMLGDVTEDYVLTVTIGGSSADRGRISKVSKTGTNAEGTAVVDDEALEWTIAISDFAGYTYDSTNHTFTTTLDFYFRAEGENVDEHGANVPDSALSFTLTPAGDIEE